MKKTVTVLYLLTACLLKSISLTSCSEPATHYYYVDATQGNDSQNDGLSASEAWKSLERLAHVNLKPGDQILFKRGEHFQGKLTISAQGTPQQPIVIGAYGTHPDKPILSAPDSSHYTVRILNSDYLTVQDLTITNHGSTAMPGRTGIKVECMDYGVSHGIRLNNLTVCDVNGSVVKKQGGGSGMLIVNGGEKKISTFDGLTIEYCHIKNCQRNAMIWSAYADRQNWHPNRNVIVRYNLIEEVPGDGIVPIGCDGALIEYNVMRRGVEGLPHQTEAAAGIWPWASDNTLIRFNECSDHKAPWDAQGFDADYNCINTVIEYNYSHDNYGGMVLVCSSGEEDRTSYCIGTENPVVRYNISIGDGNRPYKTRGKMFSPSIHIGGPVRGCTIYRNIIHNKKKASPEIDRSMLVSDDWSGYADSTLIQENVFFTPEVSQFDMTRSTNNRFVNNYYLGEYTNRPCEKRRQSLLSHQAAILTNSGKDGLMQFMDSVTIAANAKCIFVNKRKIEQFFTEMLENNHE